jgi:hypothetical protein
MANSPCPAKANHHHDLFRMCGQTLRQKGKDQQKEIGQRAGNGLNMG